MGLTMSEKRVVMVVDMQIGVFATPRINRDACVERINQLTRAADLTIFIQHTEAGGLEEGSAATAVSVSLIFLGALLTGLGLYSKIAKLAGAGTVVPITGFANSVVAPALEFKTDVRCIIRIVRETRNRRVSGLNPT